MTPDHAYFLERAEAAIEMAQKASNPSVVHVHCQLADLYLNEAYGDGSGRPVTNEQVRSRIGVRR